VASDEVGVTDVWPLGRSAVDVAGRPPDLAKGSTGGGPGGSNRFRAGQLVPTEGATTLSSTIAYDSAAYAKVNRLDPHHLQRIGEWLPDLRGQDVLEVGCGRGHLLRALQEAGADAIGVDVNPQAIAQGVADGMSVAQADALPFPDESFDALVSVHTIEHLPDLDGALTEMVRVIRPGGRLILIYPAEPIMGLWAVPTATILFGNPLKAREVHCQKVTPSRLRARTEELEVAHRDSSFRWRRWPQFTTVFDRIR
jgi:SAM-dependent methyltransferase